MEPSDTVSGYRWVVMGLWMLSSVSGFMVMSTIGVLLPAISLELSLSPAQQGLLGSAAFWGNVTLAIPMSWWTSRFAPKVLTTVTMVLCSLLLFLQGWSPTFAVLLLGRLAFGIAVVARLPARAVLTQQWFPPREIVMVNSISNALFGLVVGGGLVATPFILTAFGDSWRAALYTFGAVFLALTVLWAILGKDRAIPVRQRRETSRQPNLLKGALSHRDLWIGALGFVGATTTWSGYLSFFPTLMLDAYRVPLHWAGGILALGVFLGGVAGLGFGYLVMNRVRGRVILQILGLVMAGTYVAMSSTGSVPALIVLSLINGIAWGFWPVLFTVPFHLPGIRPREVAVAMSFIMMSTSLGTALGPLVTGFLQEALGDLKPALLVVSAGPLSVSVAGLLLRAGREDRSVEIAGVERES